MTFMNNLNTQNLLSVSIKVYLYVHFSFDREGVDRETENVQTEYYRKKKQ